MAILTSIQTKLGVNVRGKAGHDGAPDPFGVHGIYRVRHRWKKVIQEKLPFYIPTNPRTVPQQANRQKMSNAVVAWQALTDKQRKVYNVSAIGRHMSGFNVFLSQYLLSH